MILPFKEGFQILISLFYEAEAKKFVSPFVNLVKWEIPAECPTKVLIKSKLFESRCHNLILVSKDPVAIMFLFLNEAS